MSGVLQKENERSGNSKSPVAVLSMGLKKYSFASPELTNNELMLGFSIFSVVD